MTDPRRRLDERQDRRESDRVPFIETYREAVAVDEPLGLPSVREIIVVRIDQTKLRLYGFLVVVIAIVVSLGLLGGE